MDCVIHTDTSKPHREQGTCGGSWGRGDNVLACNRPAAQVTQIPKIYWLLWLSAAAGTACKPKCWLSLPSVFYLTPRLAVVNTVLSSEKKLYFARIKTAF